MRHAQSIGNEAGSYAVPDAGKLSERGQAQARQLAEELSEVEVDVVASSPLERARGTIRPYLDARDQTGQVWAELAEGCNQPYQDPAEAGLDSLRHGPDLELSDEEGTHFTLAPGEYPACRRPDEETFAEALARVDLAGARIEALLDGEARSVLVVAHYHYLARLIERLLGIEPGPEKRFKLDNAAVTKLVKYDSDESHFALRYVHRLDPLE